MNPNQLNDLIYSELTLLDGATGTHLQSAGLPAGESPEAWVLKNPTVLQDLQESYFRAGSRIILSFTFGGNRPKLSRHFGKDADVSGINQKLAAISIAVRDRVNQHNSSIPCLVAGDVGPTGRFLFPAGDMSLEEMVDLYREQVRGLLAAGVDLFVVETMIDLAETRAAVLAIQSECDLPILASLTFSENGHTLSGNTPLVSLLTLAGLGVAACGINCSFGPEKLGELIEPLRMITPIPLLLKPNAGLPQLVDGKTVFPMDPDTFARKMLTLAGHGVQIIGGCCGTGPAHIAKLSEMLTAADMQLTGSTDKKVLPLILCSARQTTTIDGSSSWPTLVYTGPDTLADDILDAAESEPGAVILDVDSGLPEDEWSALAESVIQSQAMAAVPMVFFSTNPALLEYLLRYYCGRAGFAGSVPARQYGGLLIEFV